MNSSTRIAHIVEATEGGVARHVLDLVSHLNPETFSCVLYLSFDRPGSCADAFRAMAQARRILLREISLSKVFTGQAERRLCDWLREDGVHLVHAHSAKAGCVGRLAAARVGLPAIYTPHAFPFQRTTDWRRSLYRIVERRLARRTARIICVSAGEYREAVCARLPAKRLVVIPNGIDAQHWTPADAAQRQHARAALGINAEEIVIGSLARLTPQKGIDLLLSAAVRLLPRFPQARMLIWGEGPCRPRLLQMIRRLPHGRAQLLNMTTAPQETYAAMDLYCAPSRWEAGPYAVLEAMACGLPVVASAVPGHVDYLEPEVSGLLAPPGEPEALAEALRTLLAHADRRYAMGQAARARVAQEFSLEHMIAETTAVYQAVMREGLPT